MYITGKRARFYVNRYNNTPYRTLSDCYKNYSPAKERAWVRCLQKSADMDGYAPRVLSYNSQTFTAAWHYTHPDTGVLMLHVETYANSYDMEM